MIPEVDVLNRVKRETAREARERRAAKRREADSDLIAQGPSTGFSKKGKRRRRSTQLGDEEAIELPLSDEQSPSIAVSDEISDIESVTEQRVDNSYDTGNPPFITTQDGSTSQLITQPPVLSESPSSAGSPTSPAKSLKSSDTSRSCSSDSEDELIDIGSPLSPPTDHTSPVISLSCQRVDSPLSSPSIAVNDSNSPRKGFFIYSETVIEQSEQTYVPMTYQKPVSTFDSQSLNTLSHFSREPVSGSVESVSGSTHPSSTTYQQPYGEIHKSWPSESDRSRHDSEATDVSSPASSSSSSEEEQDVGGVPVTWENNSINVQSEAVSEDTDLSADECDTRSNPNVGTSPIMPLRIDKRKVRDFVKYCMLFSRC